jgi:hypothetical protein
VRPAERLRQVWRPGDRLCGPYRPGGRWLLLLLCPMVVAGRIVAGGEQAEPAALRPASGA